MGLGAREDERMIGEASAGAPDGFEAYWGEVDRELARYPASP